MSSLKQSLCPTRDADAMWKRRLIWGVWLLVALLLYFFENNVGTRTLLAASAVLPTGSILCAVLSEKKFTPSLCVPKKCEKNDAAACVVHTKGLLPCALFCGSLEAENRLTGEKTVLELSVSAFSAEESLSLCSSHCGTIHIAIAGGRVQDWFGLWHSPPVHCASEYLSVLPALFAPEVSLVEHETVSAEGERWSMTRPGSDPSETFAIREYMPGDPVRQIHWKLSQKTDSTMLRELGLPVVEQTLLLLDTSASDSGLDAAAMSAALETLLSLSGALLASDIAHSVGWKNRILNELELCEVRTGQEYTAVQEQLLAAFSALDAESVCACFRKWGGGDMYAHTVVCAAAPPPDIASLCAGNRVTLLLSGGKQFDGVHSDMHVRAYSPENAQQELKYIEI